MKSVPTLLCAAALLSAAFQAHAQTAPATPVTSYKLYDIGPPAPGTNIGLFDFDNAGFTPSCLNSAGQSVGSYDTSPITAGSYFWDGKKTVALPALPNANILHGGSNAFGLNDSNVVIGISAYGQVSPYNGAPLYHAVSWRHGVVQDLGDLGGGDSWANYINNQGLVVGYAYNTISDPFSFYGNQYHATTWLNGAIQDLGTLGGTDSEAWTANAAGDVIGISLLNTPLTVFGIPQEDAFLWSKGQMHDLGNLGGAFSTPTAVNRRAQVTVLSFDASNQRYQSYLWQEGRKVLLSALGGDFVEATALNDLGVVTGASTDPTNANFQAEVWLSNGNGMAIGAIGGDPGSVGLGINHQGTVVGGSGSVTLAGNNYAHAFVWQNGVIQDLNTLVPAGSSLTLNVAYYINDKGMIAGLGTNSVGAQHAFVLVPQGTGHLPAVATSAAAPAAPGSFVHAPSTMQNLLRHLHSQNAKK